MARPSLYLPPIGNVALRQVGACSRTAVTAKLALFAAVVIVCASAAVHAEAGSAAASAGEFEKLSAKGVLYSSAAVLVVFLVFVLLGYHSNRSLNRGEMRRAIAGTFVFSFAVLMFVLLHLGYTGIGEVVSGFMAMVTTIVGFYFGSRTAQMRETEGAVGVENVEFRDGQVVLSFRNGSGSSVTVDAVYVNSRRVVTAETQVAPLSLAEIPVRMEWEAGKEYAIKVCTSSGRCSEVRVKAPDEGLSPADANKKEAGGSEGG
ncbi:MAG: hypothetical protein GXO66_03145 [Euryarchaeota archaeon]|nr:hypothetical protein [Euryarchaeota archaeon]